MANNFVTAFNNRQCGLVKGYVKPSLGFLYDKLRSTSQYAFADTCEVLITWD